MKSLIASNPARFMVLMLLPSFVCLQYDLGRAGVDNPEFREALMNPKHKVWRARSPETFRVRLKTSKGTILIESHRTSCALVFLTTRDSFECDPVLSLSSAYPASPA